MQIYFCILPGRNNGDHVKEKLFQTVSESCQESTFQQLTQWSLAMAARALLML